MNVVTPDTPKEQREIFLFVQKNRVKAKEVARPNAFTLIRAG